MALATQCPHCQTTFRVAHDQLKLRAGLVRCGACKEIFNGIEHLLRPADDSAPSIAVPMPAAFISPPARLPAVSHTAPLPAQPEIPAPAEPAQPTEPIVVAAPVVAAPAAERFADAADLYPAFDLIAPSSPAAAPMAIEYADSDAASTDPLQRMTLMQFSDEDEDEIDGIAAAAATPSTALAGQLHAPSSTVDSGLIAAPDQPAGELDQAIDSLRRKPWRGTKKSSSRDDDAVGSEFDSDAEEPSFVTRARRRAQAGGRRLSTVLLLLLLTLVACGQAAYAFRDVLAAHVPSVKPWLMEGCKVLDCQIELPAQADAISIESNELTVLNAAKNTFTLNLLLRNRSSTAQRWPNIELTLLDASDRPVIRRIFSERDYLSTPQDSARGFAANSEQSVKIGFELKQQKASNYRVYPFYP